MNTKDIKKMFIEDCYGGDLNKYKQDRKDDYYKVQFEWSCYIDSLCKNGVITQKQYDTVTF